MVANSVAAFVLRQVAAGGWTERLFAVCRLVQALLWSLAGSQTEYACACACFGVSIVISHEGQLASALVLSGFAVDSFLAGDPTRALLLLLATALTASIAYWQRSTEKSSAELKAWLTRR